MAVNAAVLADELVALLGLDPRSLWPTVLYPPPVPAEERKGIVWTDGVQR
jgi:hypothetical protein